MTKSNQQTSVQKVITFSPTLYNQAEKKAMQMGVAFPEYVRHLLLNDVSPSLLDNELMLSDVQEQRLEKSYADLKTGKFKTLRNKNDIEKFVGKL